MHFRWNFLGSLQGMISHAVIQENTMLILPSLPMENTKAYHDDIETEYNVLQYNTIQYNTYLLPTFLKQEVFKMFSDDEQLIVTTIRLRQDQILALNQLKIKNFSAFFREILDEKIGNPEEIQAQIDLLSNRKQKLISENIKKPTSKVPNEIEVKFLKQSKEILERDPSFLSGRCKLYENTFGKKISASTLLEKIDELQQMQTMHQEIKMHSLTKTGEQNGN